MSHLTNDLGMASNQLFIKYLRYEYKNYKLNAFMVLTYIWNVMPHDNIREGEVCRGSVGEVANNEPVGNATMLVHLQNKLASKSLSPKPFRFYTLRTVRGAG